MKSSAFLLALALAACALTVPPDHGVPAAAPPATSADPAAEFAAIRPLLKTYCAKCHNPSDQDGGVDFASISESSVTRHRALWKRAARRLAAREMPPDDAKQPNEVETKRLAAWMRRAAEYVDPHPDRQDPGPAPLRRLTRTEYDNTIRDLFAIGFDSRAEVGMPADEGGEGHFENLAVNLGLSDALTEKYFAAAECVTEKVFASGWQGDQARRRLFVVRPGPKLSERDAAKQVVTTLARRAYRRPATEHDVARLMRFYDRAKENRASFEDAVRAVLKPVLVSPQFLFRLEQDRPAERKGKPGAHVDDHELAVRLSYFLWASMPDDELFRVADEKKLSDPAVLRKQVRRMLDDRRAAALTRTFGLRWLQVDRLDRARPTTEFFPAFNHQLRHAMREEVTHFLDHLRTADRSVLDLLDADYTFANATLARHYGIEGVAGEKMQKVTLKPEHHRGGLLGMAGPLTLTSHTSRTSPTQRGKYVLEVIFNTPPPPPPPNVPALKEEPKKPKEAPRSFREQLAAHATQASCAGCHRKIDPLGFALDNYDGIGTWREGTKERPLDVSGVLPGGEKVDGVAGLKKVVLSRKDDFVRGLAEKLLEYALGRTLDADDELAVRNVVAAMKKDDHKFSALVNGVIDSTPFRERRAR